MMGRRRLRLVRAALSAGLAVGAIATWAPAADAAAPRRVGWWTMLSAGSVAAPSPGTPEGGMHIAAGPGQVLAYGAVLYPLAEHASFGQLRFDISGSQGTVKLLACPTKGTAWSAGDDQPADKAPAYDCQPTRITGAVAANGKTVTFALSALPAKSLSLAIIPDVSAPFSVDIDKPDASSLAVTSGSTVPAAPPPPPTIQSAPAPAADANTSTTAAGRPLGVPNLPAPSTAQAPSTDPAPAPQVATSAPPPAAAAPAANPANRRSVGSTVGGVVGVLALIAAFLFWGLGRGLLGGRIQPLSSPARSAQS
jgi:hypothetical protein